MATPAEIRQAVDSKLSLLQAAITTRQDTFFAANGRYWQGKRLHTGAIPADGVEVLPNIGTGTPSNETQPWPVGIRTTAMPMSLEVHTYAGPQGHGYVVILTVQINATTWWRIFQVGPETYRARPWHQQVDIGGLAR